MDNSREQSTPVVVENKGSLISRKVWDIQTRADKVVNVMSNGNVPLSIQMKMEKNKLMPTDYIERKSGDPNEGKRLHIQKINNIIESKYL